LEEEPNIGNLTFSGEGNGKYRRNCGKGRKTVFTRGEIPDIIAVIMDYYVHFEENAVRKRGIDYGIYAGRPV
jgi:hypothetical protein